MKYLLFLILPFLFASISVIPNRTDDGREITATNRIPDGYTQYFTGQADDITNGTRGGGADLKLTNSNSTARFQIKDLWYAIGGRGSAFSISFGDYLEAKIVGPATTGLTETTGDFNKVEITPSSGLYMIVPASPGTGSWSMDLSAKIGSSQVHKATPIPNATTTGWFSYDEDTNTISSCASATCAYDLFDFDVDMFYLCRKCWLTGGEIVIESSDIVGKKILPHWVIDFTLSGGVSSTIAITLTTAVKE